MRAKDLLALPYAKEAIGFGCAILCAVLLTWLLTEFSALGYLVSADTGYMAVVAVAIFVFALMCGRLTEFSFGGVSAKFQAAAKDEVAAQSISEAGQTLYQFEKGAISMLPELLQRASRVAVAAVEIDLGHVHCDKGALVAYAREFLAVVPKSYVIVTREGQFIGIVETSQLVALCSCERLVESAQVGPASNDLLQQFVDLVNGERPGGVTASPILQTHRAQIGIDNKTALRKMNEYKTDFLVLVDGKGRAVKIVLRQEIVDRLLLAIAA